MLNPDWLVPQWPVPSHVRAVCTTRAGGYSVGPYAGLNLGAHVGDDPAHVAANRVALQQAIGAQPVFLSQVHGTDVETISASSAHDRPADAAITDQRGVACTVMVADCLPVLFTNASGSVVAAAHAGWRGLLGSNRHGVLEQLVRRFRATPRAEGEQGAFDCLAWLGPCIGPSAFEVGAEVRAAFMADDPAAQAMFVAKAGGKWLANLPGLARQRLRASGVSEIYGNDASPAWCTVSQSSRFFSYRRDGVSGRFAACIWRA